MQETAESRELSGFPREPSQMPTKFSFQHPSQPKGSGALVVPANETFLAWLLLLLLLSPNVGEARIARE